MKIPYCQRAALAQLDTVATELAKAQAAAKVVDWRRSFRTFGVQALRLGASLVRPTAAPPVFSAAEMRSEWDAVWKRVPKGTGHAEAWREQATRAGLKPTPTRQWDPPNF